MSMRLVLAGLIVATLAACDAGMAPDDGAVVDRLKISEEKIPTDETTTEPPPVDTAAATPVITGNNPTISDTQDFGAVKERLSIEDDKALLEAQKEKFSVVTPTALPPRVDTGNVVQYALTTTNKVGEKIYKRSPLGGVMTKRACGQYRLPDDAQAAVLNAGGPQKDPKGLDPDGDGFACTWSPDTYRALAKK